MITPDLPTHSTAAVPLGTVYLVPRIERLLTLRPGKQAVEIVAQAGGAYLLTIRVPLPGIQGGAASGLVG